MLCNSRNINKVMVLGGILGLLLTSCNNNVIKVENLKISEDTKYGGVIVDLEYDKLTEYGIKFGDSVSVKFSNGFEFNDIPYYSGYYVKTGNPLLVCYQKVDDLKVTRNNEGIWDEGKFDTTMTVNIYLNESKKYIDTEEALSQIYSDDISKYDSKEKFANFREIKVKNMKEGVLFRGASPINNLRSRAAVTDSIIKEHNINFVMDLADSEEEYEEFIKEDSFNSPYFKELHDDDKTILLSMNSAYQTQAFREKVVQGLNKLILNEGPYYIHCNEGKDRTGFVCLLLEALVDSTYDELKNDYMTTYFNYFGISESSDLKKYNAILDLYCHSYMSELLGTDDVTKLKEGSYKEGAIEYLKKGGMKEEGINKLIKILSK